MNSKGVSRFSQETDAIIFDLIEWFNVNEKADSSEDKQLKEKLFAILQLFGIPVSLLNFSLPELWYEVRFQNFECMKAISPLYLTEVISNIAARRGVCECYKTNIAIYPTVEALQPHLREITPELEDYYCEASRDINSTLNQFENDFYAGTFKP